MGKLPIPGSRLWRPWSKEDDKLLARAVEEGASLVMACAALRRTPNSIRCRMRVLARAGLTGRKVPAHLRSFPVRWQGDYQAVTARMDRSTYPGRAQKTMALKRMKKC